MKQRILSIILAAVLILNIGMPSASAAASVSDNSAAIGESGLCEHHTEHNADCGYTEGEEGSACTYICAECAAQGSQDDVGQLAADLQSEQPSDEQSNVEQTVDQPETVQSDIEQLSTEPAATSDVCTCEAVEGEAHTEGCPQYTETEPETTVCSCAAADETHGEDCPLYTAPAETETEGLADSCTCETDDPALHATDCPAYVAPENPECFCAEKCTEDTINVWCDVCGVQGADACEGEDTAAVYAATTYNISASNDGNTNNDNFAALIADFDGNSDPHTSGTITVTGSREGVTEAVSLTIPTGVTVIWNADLSGGGTDGLLILSGGGTLTLGDGVSIISTSSGITSNSFTGSVTIAEGSDVTITASGNYGMALDSASLSVGSGATLAVSASKQGIDTSGTFTVGSKTHIVIKGGTSTTNSYPSTVDGDYYERSAGDPNNLATAKFEKNGDLSGARSLEIITADHIDPNSCLYEDESVHSFTCVTGCPIKVNNATAAHVYDNGSSTCSVCNSDVYNVWVGGVRVTGGNKADVLGTADEGETVVFTPADDSNSAILTLNGAAITGVYQGASIEYGIFAGEGLIIQLEGSNSIKATPADTPISYVEGIFVNGGLTIKGSGSLTVTAGGASQSNYGIYATTVTIENSAVAAICETGENDYGIVANSGSVTVDGGVLYAKGSYCGMSDSSTLTVKGDCHITIDGNNPSPAPTIADDAGTDYTYYWLSSQSSDITNAAWVKNPAEMSGAEYYQFLGGSHAEVTSTEESHTIACADQDCSYRFSHTDPEGHVDGSDADTACDDCGFEAYDVWVGGTRVTSMNKDDVLGDGKGSVKYDPVGAALTVNGEVTVNDSYNDETSTTYGIYTKEQLVITGNENSSLTVGGNNVTYGVYCVGDTGLISVKGGMTLSATGSHTGIHAYEVYAGTNNSGASDDTSSINATGGSYGIHAGSVALYDANRVEATSETGVGIAHMGDYDLSLYVNGSGHLIAEGEGGALSLGEMPNLDLVMNGNCTGFWRFAENDGFESGDDNALGDLGSLFHYEYIDKNYLEIIASGDMTYADGTMTCSHNVSIEVAAMLEYTYSSKDYTLYFSGLQPAMDVANGFGPAMTNIKLTLLRDVTVTDAPLTITNDLPLDLAGFEISGSINGALLEVATNENANTTGALTITDSSTGKTGSISNSGTNGIGVQVSAGTLTIEGGTITGTTCGAQVSGGTLTVTGGTITGQTYGINHSGSGTLTIEGGAITGNTAGIYLGSMDSLITIGAALTGSYTFDMANAPTAAGNSVKFATAGTGVTPDTSRFQYIDSASNPNLVVVTGDRVTGGANTDLYLLWCEHSNLTDGECGACGQTFAASVTSGGASTLYQTLSAAVTALNSSADNTLTLLADATEAITVTKGGTVDLGGKSITVTGDGTALSFTGNGNLKNSGTTGSAGKVQVTGGTLTIEGAPAITSITLGTGGLVDVSGATNTTEYPLSVSSAIAVGGKVRVGSGENDNSKLTSENASYTIVNGADTDANNIYLAHKLGSVTVKLGNATATPGSQANAWNATYNGSEATVEFTAADGTAIGNNNYELLWFDNDDSDADPDDESTAFSGAPSNAGNYTFKFSGDSNSNDYYGVTYTGTLVIDKATPVITWGGAPYTKEYTGSLADISATIDMNSIDTTGTITYSYTGTVNGQTVNGTDLPINAGSYTVTASYAGDDNHEAASAEVSLTITQVSITNATVTLQNDTVQYSSTEQAPTITSVALPGSGGTLNTTDYDVSYSKDGQTVTSVKDVGTYSVTVTGKGNYKDTATTVTYTITAATPTVSFTEDSQTVTYSGTAITPGINVTLAGSETYNADVNGELVYSYTGTDANNNNVSGDGIPVNAGTYTITAKLPAKGNYAEGSDTMGLTIEQITATESATLSVLYNETSPQPVDLLALLKALPGWVEGDTHVYGTPVVDNNNAKINSANMSGDNLSVTLASGLSATDKEKVNVTVEVTGLTNYSKVTITVTVDITDKKIVTVDASGVSVTGKTYDGQPVSVSGTPTGSYDNNGTTTSYTDTFEAVYTGTLTDGSAYAATTTVPTDAGSYAVYFRVPLDNGSFTGDSSAAPITFTISQKQLSWTTGGITVKDQAYVPGKTTVDSVTGSPALDGMVSEDAVDFTVTDTTYAFADDKPGKDKTITATVTGLTLTGTDAANYLAPPATYTLKGTITAPATGGGENAEIIENGNTTLIVTKEADLPSNVSYYGDDAKAALETKFGTDDTIGKIEVHMETAGENAIAAMTGVDTGSAKVTVLEISLKYWDTAESQWVKITKDNLSLVPAGGVDVVIPYSLFGFTDVTNSSNYKFVVKHMITLPIGNQYAIGDVEDLSGAVTVTADGLKMKVEHGFSPFVVGFAKTSTGGGGNTATITGVTVRPATATVNKGASQQFTAAVSGTGSYNTAVTWSISGNISSNTKISANGLLTIGADETASAITVKATAVGDTSKSGTAAVTVQTGGTAPTVSITDVTVYPATATVNKGASQQFTAAVSGTGSYNTAVTWSISGNTSSNTKISANGLLTIGSDETASAITVKATAVGDTSKSGTAAVTVQAGSTGGGGTGGSTGDGGTGGGTDEPGHTHSFGEWVVTKEPTETTEGQKERRCSCGQVETAVIPKKTTGTDDNPQTGDSSKAGLWLTLMSAALCGILSVLFFWKRRSTQDEE